MENLTLEQLKEQRSAINTTRFLMENVYNGSDNTIKELSERFKLIDQEIANRLYK